MKSLPLNNIKKTSGLTLLEVLVALVILAIALTAVVKATGENIRSTAYLQEKTIGTWVGLNTLNKARLQLLTLSEYPEHSDETETMLNQSWEWQASIKKTGNPRIKSLHVQVFHQPEHRFITELTSYIYVEQT